MASNTIPNLSLVSGTLVLGTNFQSGAITNLTLDGTTLSNTLPVTGTFAVTNSVLTGSFVVSNGAVFTVNAVALEGQITVEGGGKMLLVGSPTYVGNGAGTPNNTNYWLWMQPGAQLNAGTTMVLLSPMTNSGTCYMTNEGFEIFNNNTAAEPKPGECGWRCDLSCQQRRNQPQSLGRISAEPGCNRRDQRSQHHQCRVRVAVGRVHCD